MFYKCKGSVTMLIQCAAIIHQCHCSIYMLVGIRMTLLYIDKRWQSVFSATLGYLENILGYHNVFLYLFFAIAHLYCIMITDNDDNDNYDLEFNDCESCIKKSLLRTH